MTSLPDISRYATALSRIFARGGCWPEAGGANWMSLMRAFAHEFRRTDLRLLQLIEEADPRTCSETLEDWERVYGLPDPCAPENVTIEERRAALLALIRAKGGSSIPFFTELARELGYGVEIVEHRPFVFGRSPFGYQKTKQQMGSPLMRYVWTVKMKTPRARWFRFGVGGGRFGQDPHLSIERATHVECAFRRRKPSHTEIVFSYEHEIDVPGLAAVLLSADQDIVTGSGNAVQSWSGTGRRPLTLLGNSDHITAVDGVVRAGTAGNGSLSEVATEPYDLAAGLSVYAVCHVRDVTGLGASNRLVSINAGAGTPFQVVFPNGAAQILMATSGGNVAAAGLLAEDLETPAVWGFVFDVPNKAGRILRNGMTLASGPLDGALTGITQRRFLLNAAIDLKGALMIEKCSPEFDAAATDYLTTRHAIT